MESVPSREEELAKALGANQTIKLPQRSYSPIEMAAGKPVVDVELAKMHEHPFVKDETISVSFVDGFFSGEEYLPRPNERWPGFPARQRARFMGFVKPGSMHVADLVETVYRAGAQVEERRLQVGYIELDGLKVRNFIQKESSFVLEPEEG